MERETRPAILRWRRPMALLAAASALALHPDLAALLELDRGRVLSGEWHRLLGGHLCHWSVAHWGANMLALLLLGALAGNHRPQLRWLLGGALLGSLLLLGGVPGITIYRGSSMWVAMLLPGALAALWGLSGGARLAALLLAAGYAFKTAGEATGQLVSAVLPQGIAVVWQLHLAGVLWGALGLALTRRRAQRSRSSRPSS